MNCVGSSALIAGFELPQTDEPDYRREGIAGHEAAADCLARDIDTWEISGDTYYNTVIDPEMAAAIQVYLDRVRPSIDRGKFHGQQFFIEARLAAPDIHAQMFGSVDFGALVPALPVSSGVYGNLPEELCLSGAFPFLDVTDLKMGEGIIVDPEDNAQMKYYAFMLLATKFPELEDDFPVRLTIVQPRAFSQDGPVRDWWTTVGQIKAWVVRDLLPAMNSTDDDLDPGKWCRFCPAKIVCPMQASLFRAASRYDPKEIVDISDKALGLSYQKAEAVKHYIKALEAEVLRRLQMGKAVEGTKLVNKKANRVFVDTVTEKVEGKDVEIPTLDAIKSRFGAAAFSTPELKTPAQLAELGPAAKEFVKEYAYMPVTGLTVALTEDKRVGIKPTSATERLGLDAIQNAIATAS
jgi:hypothetical protein